MSNQPPPHRKRIKHFDIPGHVRELTFSCYGRRPLLTNDLWREMLSRSIDRAVEGQHYRLLAFVFMPEHVHLIVYPARSDCQVSRLLSAIKRPFSARIKSILTEQRSQLLDSLTVAQRPGVMTFRFWQEGPGYDRNLTDMKSVLAAIDYVHLNSVRRKLVNQSAKWRWSSARVFFGSADQSDFDLPAVQRLPWA